MRGKDLIDALVRRDLGITPAYAGKRSWPTSTRTPARDHPRVCGEKLQMQQSVLVAGGSPPRMRGKDLCDVICGQQSGITPACAGKSPDASPVSVDVWDHPRVCGEKCGSSCTASVRWRITPACAGKSAARPVLRVCAGGSPPRVRGKDLLRRGTSGRHGITPACAGKSHKVRLQAAGRWDHPRVCGEKRHQPNNTDEGAGSPPRVRGKEPQSLTACAK